MPPPEEVAEREDAETLTLIVSALRVHLREDTYRFQRARTPDRRDVFEVSLWKLDRLQRLRAPAVVDVAASGSDAVVESRRTRANVDLVIEFARARSLERLRRYAEAESAYARVTETGSMLAAEAFEGRRVMREFAAATGRGSALLSTPEEKLERIDERISRWWELVAELRGTTYEPLAREEAEAWEQLRVEWFERHDGFEGAVAACRRLIERHRLSKLYGSHLLRLGDLYADAARQQQLVARVRREPVSPGGYQSLIDSAFSAYELAAEDRRGVRREADTRIEALLAYHREVVSRAR